MYEKNTIIDNSLFLLEIQYLSNIIIFSNINSKNKQNNLNLLYLFFYIYYFHNLQRIKRLL